MDGDILVERAGAVASVILNRPGSHNALTPEMIVELRHIFERLGSDESVRVIVLRGRGRSFCAGADLGSMRAAAEFTFEENVADGQAIFDLMAAVDGCPKPVVAVVQGAAIGGGAGLVSCCDVTVAVADTVFAFSEVRLGLAPAVISPFVVAKIGPGAARELFLTGERFSGERAQREGLIQHVVQDEAALKATVDDRVAQLLQAAPGAQAAVKDLIHELGLQPRESLREYTSELIARRRAGEEGREGMNAFLEKRKPRWQN